MATQAKRALKKPVTKDGTVKVDLSNCRLECHKYPQNCNAIILAEFTGGHRSSADHDPERPLTWPEWEYILGVSTGVNVPQPVQGTQGTLGASRVLHFSEVGHQRKFNFSGKALYAALKEQGCDGRVMIEEVEGEGDYEDDDEYYDDSIPLKLYFYQVKLTEEVYNSIFDWRGGKKKVPDSVRKRIPNDTYQFRYF